MEGGGSYCKISSLDRDKNFRVHDGPQPESEGRVARPGWEAQLSSLPNYSLDPHYEDCSSHPAVPQSCLTNPTYFERGANTTIQKIDGLLYMVEAVNTFRMET
jgi:hypothetical protein